MTKTSLGAALLLAISGAAAAQGPSSGLAVVVPGTTIDGPFIQAPTWGTAQLSAYSLPAHAFTPIESSVTYGDSMVGGGTCLHRTNAVGDPWFIAPVNLPTGSVVEAFEIRVCDSDPAASFGSWLVYFDKNGSTNFTPLVTTSSAEAPGCINRSFTFLNPVTIDNGNKTYTIEINLGTTGPGMSFCQARVYYRLQVSPAPATATFPLDTPTSHPYFRFIEALAASGVTAGCAPQSYCPDSPITRGEMAVFLATALGLHFPN